MLSKKWTCRFSEVLELHVKPGVNILYTLGGGVLFRLPKGQSSVEHTSFVDRDQLWAGDIP